MKSDPSFVIIAFVVLLLLFCAPKILLAIIGVCVVGGAIGLLGFDDGPGWK